MMKWFKHDSSAHRDSKLKKLKHKHGIVGYGLYWYCLELIAGHVEKGNIKFELEDDAELIALEWDLDRVTVSEIMHYMVELELFENSSGRITCLKMAFRLDDTNSRNPEMQKIISALKLDLKEEQPLVRDGIPGISEDSPDRTEETRLEEIRQNNPESPSFSFAKHLSEQYGYAPHLFKQKDMDTFKDWFTKEVTKVEFKHAHCIACERKDSDTPSIAYINGIIKNARSAEAKKLKKKKSFKPAGQTKSTDPLGENTEAYEEKAARELAELIKKAAS